MKTDNAKLVKLIPPDVARCQAETIHYRPFVMGGNVHDRRRCESAPVYISKERVAGPDGRRGSMSLCAECADVLKRELGEDYATLTPIKKP